MKLLCLLFLSFILLLSVKPCCVDDSCDGQRVSFSVKKSKLPQQKDCGGCSPFFSCGSCTGFTLMHPVNYTLEITEEPLPRSYPPYHSFELLKLAQAIWQPPQLG